MFKKLTYTAIFISFALLALVTHRLGRPQPEDEVFVPSQETEGEANAVGASVGVPTVEPTAEPTATALVLILPETQLEADETINSAETKPIDQPTTIPINTPQPSPTPLPINFFIQNIEYQHQHGFWNYCGPANLAMAITNEGIVTDRTDVGGVLRGGLERYDDKNISPEEMVYYVESQTNLQMAVRSGGTLQTLKNLLSSGFPVIIEKGYELPEEGWMGHYLLIHGYDDTTQEFAVHDTFEGENIRVGYADTLEKWAAFNHTFMVVYNPMFREKALLNALGAWESSEDSTQIALDYASNQLPNLSGKPLFFGWFNLGTNLVVQGDYLGAADAYDNAFAVYAELPANERPHRMLWYQFGPYEAYFGASRFQDVINLATTTLDAMNEPILEESFYWRGLAHEALGDGDSALADLRKAVELNPNWQPAVFDLARLEG